MKFRKKPIVIEACQWWKNGDHPADYAHDEQGLQNGEMTVFSGEYCKSQGWEGQIVRYFRRPDVVGDRRCLHCGRIMHEHGWIDTLEGGHIVCPGDWIITGVNGEHYPCKPDIFTQTYEDAAKALPDEAALVEAMAQHISAVTHHTYSWSELFARAALDGIRPTLAALQARAEAAEAENARLRPLWNAPPKHDFWGAGERGCPREIKAGNGELRTLRCKICGVDNPRDDICRAALGDKS